MLYLGQYGGYELDDPAADPCGSATYRLTILTEGGHDWLLEMPEAYSACRLWVNGEAYYSSGEPDPERYSPAIADAPVAIRAEGAVELVISVSNFDSFYSGLIYRCLWAVPVCCLDCGRADGQVRPASRCFACVILAMPDTLWRMRWGSPEGGGIFLKN